MKISKLIFLSLLTLCIASCSYDSEDDLTEVTQGSNSGGNGGTGGGGTGVNSTNYIDDIKPIMESSCISCHASPPVNGAPFALVTFEQVSQRANRILSTMSAQSGAPGAMPPSGRLPQATIDLVQQWISNGKPEN